ncbi:helix-turn-helix transcriptional regulator [Streptomyces sp. R302]|uniref:Scr1 family TA system antitoxin-like transcriptional regulator n=1 Tax=unclassified Streptomyces TaxID=2593676 RepID=UPI00145D3CDC|nr:helix-turn-helix transcriptional regulator [Streptomyces sp. R301]NML79757.1 helix-turn-helix transcriptional regulator [Streptomyces sp. R302]
MADDVPKGSEPETSESLKAFGEVLKAFRKRAGLTQEQFAPRVGYSLPMVASIEQGRRVPSKKFVDKAEEVLDAFGVIRAAAKHLTRRAGLAKWFEEWAELEPLAVTLYTFESRLVPGLLQTPAYARTLFERQIPAMGDDKIESNLVTRMERASILTGHPETIYSFIIEEHALRRQVAEAEIMRKQIDHILALGERRNIDVQVMSQSRGHHSGLDGPLRLLETHENAWHAYCEGQETGQLFSEAKVVSILQQRYARMRAQALSVEASVGLLREIRGAL